jgi:hypothetical protein
MDQDNEIIVGLSTDATRETFYPQSTQGQLLRRLDTPLKEAVVQFNLDDPRIKIIKTGEYLYQIENATR